MRQWESVPVPNHRRSRMSLDLTADVSGVSLPCVTRHYTHDLWSNCRKHMIEGRWLRSRQMHWRSSKLRHLKWKTVSRSRKDRVRLWFKDYSHCSCLRQHVEVVIWKGLLSAHVGCQKENTNMEKYIYTSLNIINYRTVSAVPAKFTQPEIIYDKM